MPQGRKNANSRATESLSSNNPSELGPNQKLEKRKDGSVWLVEVYDRVVDQKSGKVEKVKTARRVDSDGDINVLAAGEQPWWKPLLDKQTARAQQKSTQGSSKGSSSE